MKTEKARLDADRTAKPKTTLVAEIISSSHYMGCGDGTYYGDYVSLTLVSDDHPPIKVTQYSKQDWWNRDGLFPKGCKCGGPCDCISQR